MIPYRIAFANPGTKITEEDRMSYKKADKILPKELLELIQQYVEGESIYIPRRTENRRSWGDGTGIRQLPCAVSTREAWMRTAV